MFGAVKDALLLSESGMGQQMCGRWQAGAPVAVPVRRDGQVGEDD